MVSEVYIAVVGETGMGKTTFISKATGRSDLEVGHGIDSSECLLRLITQSGSL